MGGRGGLLAGIPELGEIHTPPASASFAFTPAWFLPP